LQQQQHKFATSTERPFNEMKTARSAAERAACCSAVKTPAVQV